MLLQASNTDNMTTISCAAFLTSQGEVHLCLSLYVAGHFATIGKSDSKDAENKVPHPEIPGSDLSPSPKRPQPPVRDVLLEQISSHEASSDMSEVISPSEPELPEAQLDTAQQSQKGCASSCPQVCCKAICVGQHCSHLSHR